MGDKEYANAETQKVVERYGVELFESIRNGKYKPSPLRRVEISKNDRSARQFEIPTVIERVIQQTIA